MSRLDTTMSKRILGERQMDKRYFMPNEYGVLTNCDRCGMDIMENDEFIRYGDKVLCEYCFLEVKENEAKNDWRWNHEQAKNLRKIRSKLTVASRLGAEA
jgi:hypothetical protein